MLSPDIILRAVLKLIREYVALARERVLPWYKGKGLERGETSKSK